MSDRLHRPQRACRAPGGRAGPRRVRRPGRAHRRDRRRTAIDRRACRVVDAGDLRRAARARRHARAHQRARPHRLGRLRDRQRARRRPAASRRSSTCRSTAFRRRRRRRASTPSCSAATGRCHVDVGFWGGVVPGNAGELEPLAGRGVLGFKCFLSPSGVDEFEHVSEADLREALPVLARLGLPLLVHAELPALLAGVEPAADPRSYRTWLATRPPASEQAAIELLIGLAREYRRARPRRASRVGRRADVAARRAPRRAADHRRDLPALPDVLRRRHRRRRDRVQVRAADPRAATIASAVGGARPRRHRSRRHRSFAGAARAEAPRRRRLRRGVGRHRVAAARACRRSGPGAAARGYTLEHVARWLAAAPARLAGLDAAKGAIEVGRDADLVVFDPDATFVVDAAGLLHRHPITPYDGHAAAGCGGADDPAGRGRVFGRDHSGDATGELLTARARSRSLHCGSRGSASAKAGAPPAGLIASRCSAICFAARQASRTRERREPREPRPVR